MRSERWPRLIAAAELPILIAISPALLFPTPSRLLVLAVVPVFWAGARLAHGRVVPATPLNPALWLLLAMVGVSLFVTPDPRGSLGKVSGVILGVLLFWAIARWLTTPARLRIAIGAFVLAGLTLAVVGLLGTPAQSKVGVIHAVAATLPIVGVHQDSSNLVIRGIPGAPYGFNANAVSGCLVLFVPLQVLLLSADVRHWLTAGIPSRWVRTALVIVEAAALVVTLGTLILMQSRGAWAGLLVSIAIVDAPRFRRTRWLWAACGGLLAAAIVWFGPTRLIASVRDLFSTGVDTSLSVRLELWSKALDAIRDFPLTGMGMNMFRERARVLYPGWVSFTDPDVVHAHNNLLQTAVDLGIPGLAAYAAIWIGVTILLVRVHARAADPALRTVAAGLGMGLLAHFLFGIPDAIPLGAKAGVSFWLTLALAVGLSAIAADGKSVP
jgi:putative inorganic carbon (HCO3(-)) transporter